MPNRHAPDDLSANLQQADARLWPMADLQAAGQTVWPGFTAQCLAEVDSTNLALQRRWRSGEHQPQLLVAQRQTAGRGRLGRSWHSTEGASLTFSLGLPVPMQDWSGLSLVVGWAVADSLHPRIALKWPNDLWLTAPGAPGRKLGGILVESISAGQGPTGGLCYLVIGIGLNILPVQLPDTPAPTGVAPACLQELWPQADAALALARVLPALAQAFQDFQAHGFGPFQARFLARDVLAGLPVRLSDGQEGVAVGVDRDGAMLLNTPTGLQRVVSGEISVRPRQG